jgi:hypothetical protein
MQNYSDPKRASDPYALPDVEVFQAECTCPGECLQVHHDDGLQLEDGGWYWWSCFPGCLPDGEPNGPFDSEDEALADAQAAADDDEGEE